MKKSSIYFAVILIMTMIVSCSPKLEPKTITPTSTEFSSGDLAKYVELVEKPCELRYVTVDGDDTQYFRLKVTLKMKKDGFKNIDAQDIEFFFPETSIYLNDVNGIELSSGYSSIELKTNSAEDLKIKKLLTGNKGDTAEIVFEYKTSKDDAPSWFKNAVQFTPQSSFDMSIKSKTISTAKQDTSFDVNNVILPILLKGKVEVTTVNKNVNSNGLPAIEIVFKLIKTVNTTSMCSSYGQMWIVGVGQKANGINVKELLPNYGEWRSGDSDGNEFKTFLESEPGEMITLEFTGTDEFSKDVASDLEKVKRFRLKLTK